MRHTTLELTGRYTRPRTVDIESAASMLPSLKPSGNPPDFAGRNRDGCVPCRYACAVLIHSGDVSGRDESPPDVMTGSDAPMLTNEKPLVSKGFDASSQLVSSTVVSTGVRTRTGDLRIMRPEGGQQTNQRKSNPRKDHQAESAHKRILFDPDSIHDTCQTDPDLARIVDAWPGLPDAIKAGILAMVNAASGGGR